MTNYQNLTAIYDYRDTSKYIYNSDLVDFTEYGAQLKDLIGPTVALGSTFTYTTDPNYGNGVFNNQGQIFGTVNCQNEKLALIGGFYPKSLDYSFVDESSLADKLPTGQATFQFYPNYSNNPTSSQNIFHLGEQRVVPTNYLEIIHTSTSDILINIYDNNNNLIQRQINSILVAGAMIPMEFRVEWESVEDDNNPQVKLAVYLDGEKLVLETLAASEFDFSDIKNLGFGQSLNINQFPNYYISSLLIEDKTPEFEELYTTRTYLPMAETRFTTTAQKIEPVNSLTLERLNNIVNVVNEDTSGSRDFYVNYTFKVNGTEYYFDRSSLTWKQHLEPEDISELSYMLLYKDQLLSLKGTSFKAIPYLRTIKGSHSPQITSMTVNYDEFVPYCETYPVALVYSYVRDVLGKPVQGAKIQITPSKASVSEVGNFILPKMTKVVRTGIDGYWDAQLALSSNFENEILYNFQIIIRDEVVYEVANIRVTSEGTIKFENLINENESI